MSTSVNLLPTKRRKVADPWSESWSERILRNIFERVYCTGYVLLAVVAMLLSQWPIEWQVTMLAGVVMCLDMFLSEAKRRKQHQFGWFVVELPSSLVFGIYVGHFLAT